jgi:hypothetical protein
MTFSSRWISGCSIRGSLRQFLPYLLPLFPRLLGVDVVVASFFGEGRTKDGDELRIGHGANSKGPDGPPSKKQMWWRKPGVRRGRAEREIGAEKFLLAIDQTCQKPWIE